MRSLALLLCALGTIAAAGGCRLAEVAAPASEQLLLVEAVLRAGAPVQYALLHRSMEGNTIGGEPDARVEVTGPGAAGIVFQGVPLQNCLVGDPDLWGILELKVEASCYASPRSAGYWVKPGAEYELAIETTDGRRARGRTQVPAPFDFHVPAVAVDRLDLTAVCTLPNSPFTLVWGRSEGAWSYLVSLRLTHWAAPLREDGIEAPDTLELTGVSVSASDTTMSLPAHLGLFQRGDFDQRIFLRLQEGLPAGAETVLAVLATDRNYTNAIRGGRFNPSGNVRTSSVIGDAVGVFASVVPLVIRSTTPVTAAPAPACPLSP